MNNQATLTGQEAPIPGDTSPSLRRRPWKRYGIRALVFLYLFIQVTVPTWGLYASHLHEQAMRYSWHMFSRIP